MVSRPAGTVDTRSGSALPGAGGGGASQFFCDGVAGGASATPAATATFTLTLTPAQYRRFKARRLVLAISDPADPNDSRVSAFVDITAVSAAGVNVLGSTIINAAAADVYADRAVELGSGLPELDASQPITVTGVNNYSAALRVAAVIEGEAVR